MNKGSGVKHAPIYKQKVQQQQQQKIVIKESSENRYNSR